MMTKVLTTMVAAFSTCLLPSSTVVAFTMPRGGIVGHAPSRDRSTSSSSSSTVLFSTPDDSDASLGEKFGGYTVKQRLREEVESPFRKVRLAFFGFSSASASVALYFSALAAVKANIGGYADAIPLEDALTTCAINGAGAIGFGILALREIKVGNANLERIAKGGLLARLEVEPASSSGGGRRALGNYRRASRVVIAAGGREYVNRLAMSLCSDQLMDTNTIPDALSGVDTIIVPVLLDSKYQATSEVRDAWRNAVPGANDRNFDSSRADDVIAFPSGSFANWNQYLKSDVETARGQGFDVLDKGITITVKKNGRILRRYGYTSPKMCVCRGNPSLMFSVIPYSDFSPFPSLLSPPPPSKTQCSCIPPLFSRRRYKGPPVFHRTVTSSA
jgi:hypothetical protein